MKKKEVIFSGKCTIFILSFFILFFSFASALSGFSLNNSDGSVTINDGFKDIVLSYSTDGSEISNITDWRFNNVSFAILNLPLDINQTSVNSNSTDFSSFSRNVTSMVAPEYNTSCIKGGCYKFYQNSTVPNLRMNNPLEQNSTSWSISFWIRKDVAASGFNKIFGTSNTVTCATQFDMSANSNAMTMYMANSTTAGCGSGVDTFTLSNAFTGKTGIWMQVVLVYNYPTFTVYINGTSAGSFTRTTGSSTKLSPYLYIGSNSYAANSTIDEFKIYNYSLSASEVSNLYGIEYSGSPRMNISKESLVIGNYSVSLSLVNSTSILSTNISNIITVDDTAECKTLSVGEEYFLPSNVTTITGSCFTLSNNSILNCNGYTIFSKFSSVLINNANSSTVKNCNFVSLSSSQNSFAIASGSYNSSFLNNNFISNQSQVVYSVLDSSSNKTYFFNNTFLRSTYQIYGSSSGNSTIFNNSFYCDNTTETNIYYSGGNYHNFSHNTFNNASNNTGITIDSSNYSSIHNNYFGSISQYIIGTKGLQGGSIWLTKVSFTDIYSNFVYIMNQSGVVIVVPDSIMSYNNLIHNNFVTIGNNVNVFGLGTTEGGSAYNAYNWSIYSNIVNTSAAGSYAGQHTTMMKFQNNSRYYNNSIYYGGYGLVFKDDINSQVYNNYFYNAKFTAIHPKGAKNSLFYNNTLLCDSSCQYGIYAWWDPGILSSDNLSFYDSSILGYPNAVYIGNVSTNNYFTNITYNGSISSDTNYTSIFWQWWYQPIVVNQSSFPLSGVNISVSNSTQTLFSTLTNSSGTYERHSLTQYYHVNGTNTSFGNYSVSASFLNQLITRSYNVSISHNILDEFTFDDSFPVINIILPLNLSYTTLTPLLNISSNEALFWAGYTLNGGSLTNLTNTSLTSWNATLNLSQEITNTVIIYANDTSNNQANKTITIYADSLAPNITLLSPVNSYSETSSSSTINFQFNVSDSSDINNCTLYLNGVNYSNTSNVNKSAINSISVSVTPGSYFWYVNCTDFLLNTGNSSNRNLTIVMPEEVVQNGGGSPVYIVSSDNLNKGYTQFLYQNYQVKFSVRGEAHSLKVTNVSNGSFTIVVSSTPQTFVLRAGEEKKVSLVNSSYYNLLVKLNSVYLNRGNFTIKIINELVSAKLNDKNDVPVTSVNNSEDIPPIYEEGRNYFGYYLITGVIFVLLLIVFFFLRQRRYKVLFFDY